MRQALAVALMLLGSACFAAPPEVPVAIPAQPGEIVEIVVKVPAGTEIGYRLTGGKALLRELKTDVASERVFWFNAKVGGEYTVVWWTKGEVASAATVVTVGAPVPPAPDPKPVDPKPVDPKPPAPVTSFRVIFIYESGDSLTADQRGVIYSNAIADWLDKNCTGGTKGWRRRDKDTPGEADKEMAALWAAVKPAVTVTPCVAIERNGKVEIINAAETPAKMVGILMKYREGK